MILAHLAGVITRWALRPRSRGLAFILSPMKPLHSLHRTNHPVREPVHGFEPPIAKVPSHRPAIVKGTNAIVFSNPVRDRVSCSISLRPQLALLITPTKSRSKWFHFVPDSAGGARPLYRRRNARELLTSTTRSGAFVHRPGQGPHRRDAQPLSTAERRAAYQTGHADQRASPSAFRLSAQLRRSASTVDHCHPQEADRTAAGQPAQLSAVTLRAAGKRISENSRVAGICGFASFHVGGPSQDLAEAKPRASAAPPWPARRYSRR
jgi:hypothetical protein